MTKLLVPAIAGLQDNDEIFGKELCEHGNLIDDEFCEDCADEMQRVSDAIDAAHNNLKRFDT